MLHTLPTSKEQRVILAELITQSLEDESGRSGDILVRAP